MRRFLRKKTWFLAGGRWISRPAFSNKIQFVSYLSTNPLQNQHPQDLSAENAEKALKFFLTRPDKQERKERTLKLQAILESRNIGLTISMLESLILSPQVILYDNLDRFVTQAVRKYGLKLRPTIFNALILRCKRAGDLKSGFSWLERMEEAKCERSVTTYAYLLALTAKTYRVREMMCVWWKMRRDKVKMSVEAYNMMLQCANLPKWRVSRLEDLPYTKAELAAEIWMEMVRENLTGDRYTFEVLCQLVAWELPDEEIMKFMEKVLEGKGLDSNNLTKAARYGILIQTLHNGLLRVPSCIIAEGTRELRQGLESHDRFSPSNLLGLIILARALGKPEQGMKLWASSNGKPTVEICDAVMNLGLDSSIDFPLYFFDEMREQGVKPAESTFMILLQHCNKTSAYKASLELLDLMQKPPHNLKPKKNAYKQAFWALQKAAADGDKNSWEPALNLLLKVSKDNTFSNAQLTEFFGTTLKVGVQCDHLEDALDLLVSRRVGKRRIRPNDYLFSKIIQGLNGVNSPQLALKLLHEFREKQHSVDWSKGNTMHAVASTMLQARRFDQALDLIHQHLALMPLRSQPHSLALRTVNISIDAYIGMGQPSKAIGLFSNLSQFKEGLQPDSQSSDKIIKALLQAAHYDDALKLLEEVHASGSYPSIAVYKMVLHSNMDLSLKVKALSFFDEKLVKISLHQKEQAPMHSTAVIHDFLKAFNE